jgi:isoleucyl-tRNA synthetase
MSKRLKNYPDPEIVISGESADALRLYLVDSPVVRAEDLRFQRPGVQALIKEVFLPWLNSYRFFKLSVDKLEVGRPYLFTRANFL